MSYSTRLVSTLLATALVGCAAPPGPTPHAAIPALEARLARDTANTKAALSLAEAYRAGGRLSDAAVLLERTVRLDSAAPALALLGLTYEEMERFGEARAAYGAFLERAPASALGEKVRGRLLLVERSEAAALARALLAEGGTPSTPSTASGGGVAVLPFDYVGTDPELRPLGRAVSEMLMTDLSQTDRVRLVERLRLQALLDEMQLGEEGRVDPATAARTGRLLGAARTVQGSLGGDSRQMMLQASVSDAGSPIAEQDALQRLIEAEKRLALGIYGALGVELTDAERERVLRKPTGSLQALLAFGSGLEASDAGDFARAAREFSRAASLDRGFAEARTRASDARAAAAAQAAGPAALGRQLSAGASTGLSGMTELNGLLPSSAGRDVAAEALGGESLGSRDAVLRIVLPPRP